ncbi:hypothetical protein PHYSODRAFT_297047 [Phytophthora sojae]|uniref:OTU domain-containing protein n=1 Tax=Phytophthora sojae (strain P6497) TaxID=1094619 RepID=G4YSC3_PHYSP|nr:hypothetical protein PHYSODRAFT_297047 [Phytophthora sojae]EGZ25354.1 hypothetical protein PHYSODRAFT_297047 [Phytophthora sojae]|eukprot:XP_009520642.1 hypothetical protein PHYSODRAFT_297047 [Phytophthora sojae]
MEEGQKRTLTQTPIFDCYGASLDSANVEMKEPGEKIIDESTPEGPIEVVSVADWLALLGSAATDVPPNGQCGWNAWYAAITNLWGDVLVLNEEETLLSSSYKTRAMTFMLARLQWAAELDEFDVDDLYKALTNTSIDSCSMDQKLLAIASALSRVRNYSVNCEAPLSDWVRTVQLQAMATYLREPLFVIDELETGQTFVHCHAYAKAKPTHGGNYEQSKTFLLDKASAQSLFSAMRAASVPPTVLILRHQATGNHFNAVTYPPERYE